MKQLKTPTFENVGMSFQWPHIYENLKELPGSDVQKIPDIALSSKSNWKLQLHCILAVAVQWMPTGIPLICCPSSAGHSIHWVLSQILWSRGPCHQFWAVYTELQLLLGPFLAFEKLPQRALQPAKLADSILETGEEPEIAAALWTSSLSQSSASISTLAYVHGGTSWS